MPEEFDDDLDIREEDPRNYPTRFHKKVLWSAITAVCLVIIGAIVVGAIAGTSWVLGYLQPLLVPIAVAGIIAYLLEPVIFWLMRRGMPHAKAFWIVFLSFMFGGALLAFLVIKPAVSQATKFGKEYLTVIEEPAEEAAAPVLPPASDAEVATKDSWLAKTKLGRNAGKSLDFLDTKLGDLTFAKQFQDEDETWNLNELGSWIWSHVSGFAGETATFFGRGFSSAASMMGYLLGLFLVPLYLFFFLRESAGIASKWSDYIPLRQSHLKTEIVATLKEINEYLIAYFRGQMLVSIIDGVLVALALWLVLGLPYAFLLGVFLAILGLIPYVGNIIVMIPAVLISFAHFSNPDERWAFLPQLWAYPLIVVGIFVVLQQVNGLVTAPKIVGDSVGLHPLTVIVSMLFWGLLLGGMLGALLAVPLTASVKVLFKRYIWQRRIDPRANHSANKIEEIEAPG